MAVWFFAWFVFMSFLSIWSFCFTYWRNKRLSIYGLTGHAKIVRKNRRIIVLELLWEGKYHEIRLRIHDHPQYNDSSVSRDLPPLSIGAEVEVEFIPDDPIKYARFPEARFLPIFQALIGVISLGLSYLSYRFIF